MKALSILISHDRNCTTSIKDDSTKLGEISFWVLFSLFVLFCAYAGYATYHVLLKHRGEEVFKQDYMKMFYYSADATLFCKYF